MPRRPEDDDAKSSSSDESLSDADYDQTPGDPKHQSTLYEKDSEEEDLERLVLGNQTSFRDNLFADNAFDEEQDVDTKAFELKDHDTSTFEDLQDADLFTLDTAPTGANLPKPSQTKDEAQGDAPAWEDSDDERLVISLADNNRLRKLRITEADDLVTGADYSRRLREQYLRLHPLPKWAREAEARPTKRRRRSSATSNSSLENGSDSDSEISAQPLEAFLRDVNKLAGRGGPNKARLRPEVIDIQRTREIPDTHKDAVESLSFHPEFPVLLSCSAASIIYLHHVAPDARPIPNPQLTSVQVKQVDTRRAEFLYPEGEKIFFAGRRKYFHHWDLQSGVVEKTAKILGHKGEHNSMEHFRLSPCGRYMGIIASTRKGGGVINILSAGSLQWIAAARLSSRHGIADFAWWKTGDGMTILGRDGSVGEYSMISQSFLGIWHDDGCIGGVVIALGGHNGPQEIGQDRWVAVGSNSGITNIYDRSKLLVAEQTKSSGTNEVEISFRERPGPERTFEQLVTPITVMTFSPDGQLFAFGSRSKKDALKLVHLPTCTVYRNWPTQQTPLGRITAVAFGTQSDLLAVGNDTGKIRLWEIRK